MICSRNPNGKSPFSTQALKDLATVNLYIRDNRTDRNKRLIERLMTNVETRVIRNTNKAQVPRTELHVQLRSNAIKRIIRGVLVLGIVLALKPPYPHTEAQSVQNINKQEQAASQQAQPVAAEIDEIKPQPQAPSPEPVKPEPITHPTGCEHYRQLISKYNWNVSVMLQIASAESGCNPYAVGDTWTINGLYAPSCGLFQVRTLAGRPDCESLKDPATNIEWAYKIYMGQGYPAWSVCKTKVRCW